MNDTAEENVDSNYYIPSETNHFDSNMDKNSNKSVLVENERTGSDIEETDQSNSVDDNIVGNTDDTNKSGSKKKSERYQQTEN